MPDGWAGVAESGHVHRRRTAGPRCPLGSLARVRVRRRGRCRAGSCSRPRPPPSPRGCRRCRAGRRRAGRLLGALDQLRNRAAAVHVRGAALGGGCGRPGRPGSRHAGAPADAGHPGRAAQLPAAPGCDLPDDRASQLAELPEVAGDRHFLIASRRFAAAHAVGRGGAGAVGARRRRRAVLDPALVGAVLGASPSPAIWANGPAAQTSSEVMFASWDSRPRCAAARTRRCVRCATGSRPRPRTASMPWSATGWRWTPFAATTAPPAATNLANELRRRSSTRCWPPWPHAAASGAAGTGSRPGCSGRPAADRGQGGAAGRDAGDDLPGGRRAGG